MSLRNTYRINAAFFTNTWSSIEIRGLTELVVAFMHQCCQLPWAPSELLKIIPGETLLRAQVSNRGLTLESESGALTDAVLSTQHSGGLSQVNQKGSSETPEEASWLLGRSMWPGLIGL